MKKVGKQKLSLETTTIRVLSGDALARAAGAANKTLTNPYPSYGEATCHTGSGCSNCDKCWTWTSGGDFTCVNCIGP